MGNKSSRKKAAVDERYTEPQGLYPTTDVDLKRLKKLILDSKLAPCYPPVQDLEQCSVCSVYYPSLNRSRCCMVGICTECFLQIKPSISNHPAQCPFCETYNYAVEYRGVRTKEHKTIEQVEEQRVIEESTQTRLETSSSSRLPSQLRQNRVALPEKLKSMTEHQEVQKSSASLNVVEILMRELVFEKAKRYSFDELTTFTSGFDNKIGTGAFGNVYKGRFSDGVQVAVKVLKTNDFVQHSFLTEIRTMTKVHHQNLVRFFGFCLEDHVLALVYEYMENGSLDKILAKKPLSIEWDKLYAIAVELATVLAYLHHDCKDQIIHHDVKPANVLLDSSHSPKLTDFGLANLMDTERTHLTLSKSKGTPGYAAPEIWMPFSPITYKCDVFGFGMILFEILGMERNSLTDIWFPSHVWQKLNEGKLIDVIMERGISDKDTQKATILSVAALWCVQFTPQTRPSMKTVVTVLKNVIPVNRPPNPMLPSDLSVSMQLMQSS